MNNKYQILFIFVSVLFVGGCGKQSAANSNSNVQSPPPVQAEAFHGQVYKSVDGRNMLTITSKEDCELTQDGTTLPCKYTKQTDALRVVATVMGTPQVIYFRFTDQGLQDNNGLVLLAPQQYADAMAKLRQAEEEKQRAEHEKELLAEKINQEILDCMKETKTNSSYSFYLETPTEISDGHFGSMMATNITAGKMMITDVSIKLNLVYYTESGNSRDRNDRQYCDAVVYFAAIRSIGGVGVGATANSFRLSFGPNGYINGRFSTFVTSSGMFYRNGGSSDGGFLGFKSQSDAIAAHDALQEAFNTWKNTFPDLSRQISSFD